MPNIPAVWGGDYVEQDQYLRVFVGNLRKKLEANPASPRYILTEPGWAIGSAQTNR